MHSIHLCISEVWHGSDQPVFLLRHYCVFSSSVLLDRLFLVFLLKISHRFQMGFRSGMLACQSSPIISWSAKHFEMFFALWAGANVCWKRKSASPNWIITKSALPHYCGIKEQEIPRIYTVWMVLLLKLKCKYSNILRDWFLTFISCKL